MRTCDARLGECPQWEGQDWGRGCSESDSLSFQLILAPLWPAVTFGPYPVSTMEVVSLPKTQTHLQPGWRRAKGKVPPPTTGPQPSGLTLEDLGSPVMKLQGLFPVFTGF